MEVPPYSLVVGVPARVVRSIEPEVTAWKAEGAVLAQKAAGMAAGLK
jgi:serine acetyltransferase